MRILYVEDNPTNVTLVQRVAVMGKHDVYTYGDGQTALDRFDQDKPDLILLDVQLRGSLTGLDVATLLRKKGCQSPIIALTAYAMKGDRQRCIDAGCDDYLAKPVSVTELVNVFKRYGDAVAAGKPILSSVMPIQAQATGVAPVPALAAEVKSAQPVLPQTDAKLPASPNPTPADQSPPVVLPDAVKLSITTVNDPPVAPPPPIPAAQSMPAPVKADTG